MANTDKITDAIVMSEKPYDDTIFNDKWQRECSNDELKELYRTLHGWTTLSLYNNKYKKKLRSVMKNIDNILKEREKKAYNLQCFNRWGYVCENTMYPNKTQAINEGRKMKRDEYAFSYKVYEFEHGKVAKLVAKG